ncbi:MAG TPA: hypothetical protein PKE05_13730 [Microthrixaceae bacterium]|nr:hypothetical protein [Microthrixaceae bacterium]
MPSSSAIAWIEFALAAVDAAAAESDDPALIDPEVAARLHELLEGWAQQARQTDVLALSFEVPPDDTEFLAHAFLRISDRWTSAADERGFDISPSEGDEFYNALVEAVIVGLEHAEDVSGVEFGEALRSTWPRFDRLDPPSVEPE